MLNRVLGRLLFFFLSPPAMLPSRESASLVLLVSGSANMSSSTLLGTGDGGPLEVKERVDRKGLLVSVEAFALPPPSAGLTGSSPAKGFK